MVMIYFRSTLKNALHYAVMVMSVTHVQLTSYILLSYMYMYMYVMAYRVLTF